MLKRFSEVLRIRNFLFLIFGSTVTQLGDRLTHMLLITLIAVSQPGRMFAYSQASLAFTLPVIILAPIAGILVDHWNKRNIMALAHFIQAGVLLTAPLFIYLTHSYLPFWIVIVIFFGLDVLNNTTKPALLPELVARRKLLAANSLDQFIARFATVLGMIVGGFLIRWVGWRFGFIIDASTHLGGGLLILGIVLRPTPATAVAPGQAKPPVFALIVKGIKIFFDDVKAILLLVVRDRLVLFVMASIWVANFIGGVAYTTLLFLVQQQLKLGTAGVGIFAGILAVGMIGGSLSLGMLKPTINKPLIVVGGIFIYGLLFLFGAFLIKIWFLVAVALGGGVIFAWILIAQSTILQETVAPHIRGRIFSTKEFFTNIAFIVTTFLTGIIGNLTSVRLLLFGIGTCLVVLSIFGYFLVKNITTAPPAAVS